MSEQLKPAIARIFGRAGKPIGGGFLIAPDCVITCAHVVNQACGRANDAQEQPVEEITLDFPFADGGQIKAEVVAWFPLTSAFPNPLGEPEDIAVLRLKGEAPAGTAPVALVYGREVWQHECRAFGFAKKEGRWSAVTARGAVAGGSLQIEIEGGESYGVDPGFSGTAVWDDHLNGVIGMVSWRDAKAKGKEFDAVDDESPRGTFLTPTSVLVKAWPPLKSSFRPPINMADAPPADFVARPEEYERLTGYLLGADRAATVAIGTTAALRGSGGYGKTTLARALCHDAEIQAAFPDGILWVTLGETPGNIPGLLDDLVYHLTRHRPGSASLESAAANFEKEIATRQLLLVIDDVWDANHLRSFLRGGPKCARLITTRLPGVIPEGASRVEVDAMKTREAVALLAAGIDVSDDRPLRELAVSLGEWPLLLKLVNGTLRDLVGLGLPVVDALAEVVANLEQGGLTALDAAGDESDRNRAVRATLGVSLKRLKPADLARFHELAVFPEDVAVPLPTIERLWRQCGLSGSSLLLCKRLYELALLLDLDLAQGTLRLHDVIRKFLIGEVGARLPDLHGQLLDAHRPAAGWGEMSETGEPYLWDHLAVHLSEAGRAEELIATVKDWRYLAKKTLLKKSLSVEKDLVLAARSAPADDPLHTLLRSFANTGHVFNHCQTSRDLEVTMLVRLEHLAELKEMLRDLAVSLKGLVIVPKAKADGSRHVLPDLPHPALIRTLEGHASIVWGCAMSSNGKLIVSASDDATLKVWSGETGQLLRTLEGHADWVRACAVSADGQRIVSASADGTLKVWSGETGVLFHVMEGHTDAVGGCAVSADGRLIVSASEDNTLKVWSGETGQLLRTLAEHRDRVNGCAISGDGDRIVSASGDGTLKVWSGETGQLLRTLEGHTDAVLGCALSSNGQRIVSASTDYTLKVWSSETGQLLRTLAGHTAAVRSCAVSHDGQRIVSASNDGTLKVWDGETGALLRTLAGHTNYVLGCAISSDGQRIVSASEDRTLKVWSSEISAPVRLKKLHTRAVSGCAISRDGQRIVSASADSTLKVWDGETGALLRTLAGHTDWVNGCAVSGDGQWIVSSSSDNTLKMWSGETGALRYTLEGHAGAVEGCAMSGDGKLIVSVSWDNTVKVWSGETGQLLCTLEGHTNGVQACAMSSDSQRIVSASWDNTVKVWSSETGQLLHTLEGHADAVWGCALSGDGRRIVSASADGTLKVWDGERGALLRTLAGHVDKVSGCAVSGDGKRIVSVSYDNTLKVWSGETGACLATFYADGSVVCCAIEGSLLVAGGARGVYVLMLEDRA